MSAKLEIRDQERLAFVTQTTPSVDDTAEIVAALRARFPALATPRKEDIRYATPESAGRGEEPAREVRRAARRGLAHQLELEPSARAGEIAPGSPAISIDSPDDLRREWFDGKQAAGVDRRRVRPGATRAAGGGWSCGAGAETRRTETTGREEKVFFTLPRD